MIHDVISLRTNQMRWLLSIVVLGTLAGCMWGQPSANQVDNSSEEPASSQSAFTFEERMSRILLDTRIAPAQRRRFDIGQGSITIETVANSDGILTFQYTPEVEGGYTVYECKIPISDEPVIFEIHPSGVPGKTSFDLDECKMIKAGSLHFDN